MSYIVAGASTLYNQVYKSVKGGYLSEEDVQIYLKNIHNKFLHSYGCLINSKNDGSKILKNKTYNDKIGKSLQSEQFQLFKDACLYIDSGGFQVSMNYLKRDDIPLFLDNYIGFLHQYYNNYSYAFLLDINFKNSRLSLDYIKKLNMLSYSALEKQPEHIRKKLIYVYHFRTPILYKIWEHLTDYMFKFSDIVSVGGLVALSAKNSEIILPIVPICKLINEAKKINKKAFTLHLLGEGSYKNIFFYTLIKKIAKKYHDIDISFSYDSSGVFKEVYKGRRAPILLEDGIVKLFSLRQKEVDNFKYKGMTNNEFVTFHINEFIQKINPNLKFDGNFYNEGKFTYDIMTMMLLYYPYFYKQVEEFCNKRADEVIQYYFSGDYDTFNELTFHTMKNLNFNKMTDLQRKKSYSITDALNIIETLDIKKCDALIEIYTSNSEVYFTDEFKENDCYFN